MRLNTYKIILKTAPVWGVTYLQKDGDLSRDQLMEYILDFFRMNGLNISREKNETLLRRLARYSEKMYFDGMTTKEVEKRLKKMIRLDVSNIKPYGFYDKKVNLY